MDSVKDSAATAVRPAVTPEDHPFLPSDTPGRCVRCDKPPIAACHQNPAHNPERAGAVIGSGETVKAMRKEMMDLSGAKVAPVPEPNPVWDARQRVLLELAKIACDDSQLACDRLQAAKIMLDA